MCCCCGCCGKILKIICSIIWIAIALALIACIIIFAIAWGGSKVMQDVIDKLIRKDGELDSFGAYIQNEVSDGNNPMPTCIDFSQSTDPKQRFGWKIDFNTREKMGLGVYARLSNKGIDKEVENIMMLTGFFKSENETKQEVYIKIPVNIYDENGDVVEDKKKQYVIHDRYMRLDAYGSCAGECPQPTNDMYNIEINKASVHLRISFKSVPDFINLPFDDDNFNYDEFVDVIYKIVKVFDKKAAKDVKDSMQGLNARVQNFGADDELCPLSPSYIGEQSN